jgi:outer membrane protein assembly factor BamB
MPALADNSKSPRSGPLSWRWWPAALLVALAFLAVLWLRGREEVPFQQRNLQTLTVLLSAGVLLLVWWLTFSRVPWRLRLKAAGVVLGVLLLFSATFRIRGVTGDLIPILEPRWKRSAVVLPAPAPDVGQPSEAVVTLTLRRADFPQFLGPDRTGVLREPVLDPDWASRPPQLLWRRPVGAGWSGFAISGDFAVTQEQRGEEEQVTCYHVADGRPLWSHSDRARYASTLAGEGPRCTPTVVGNRVFTLGATGILNCHARDTGEVIWARNIADDAGTRPPEWGYSGSPLVFEDKVIVSAGGRDGRSLLAYDAETGEPVWSAGNEAAGYSSPIATELAGQRQILIFNAGQITAHEPADGRVLWDYPWGNGHPHVAVPVVTDPDHVLFSSGYGVGSELLQIKRQPGDVLAASQVWQSRRMKAKFANLVARGGFLYGLDDGMLACVDLEDGSLRWKEGRYGHGQGLLVNDLLLLMSEQGELVLLRPTPDAPNELHRIRVFTQKTWNPIALAGDLLLVRNDQEAAALRVATLPTAIPPESPTTGPQPMR